MLYEFQSFPGGWSEKEAEFVVAAVQSVSVREAGEWVCYAVGGQHLGIRYQCAVYDRETGQLETQKGRTWLLGRHMKRGEIWQTMLAAYLHWVEHESRESFLVNGKAIFGPHLDPEDLLAAKEERRDPKPGGDLPANARIEIIDPKPGGDLPANTQAQTIDPNLRNEVSRLARKYGCTAETLLGVIQASGPEGGYKTNDPK